MNFFKGSVMCLLMVVFLSDLNRYCHLSALTAIPLHSKEKELQCKRSYDLQNDGQSLR